jgi:hypothetical protein
MAISNTDGCGIKTNAPRIELNERNDRKPV